MTTGDPAPPAPQTFAASDVVDAVREHADDVASAARFVARHGDDILAALGSLPALFSAAAEQLGGAAAQTRSAAAFLTGDGGTGGVRALADVAGTALERCRDELASARDMLERLGRDLEAVPIPDVRPTYSDVLGHRLVTGLDLGEGRLLAPAVEQLKDGAERFAGVGEELAKVAGVLREIGGLVDRAGQGLAGTAGRLEAGASALSTFAGS